MAEHRSGQGVLCAVSPGGEREDTGGRKEGGREGGREGGKKGGERGRERERKGGREEGKEEGREGGTCTWTWKEEINEGKVNYSTCPVHNVQNVQMMYKYMYMCTLYPHVQIMHMYMYKYKCFPADPLQLT